MGSSRANLGSVDHEGAHIFFNSFAAVKSTDGAVDGIYYFNSFIGTWMALPF